MKLFVFLLSALVAISTVDIVMSIENDLIKVDTFTTNATTVNINKLMDFIMIHVGDWIEKTDLIPMILEDYSENLEYPFAWFTLSGRLLLTSGFLTHLTTVVRSGNAIMSYDQSNSWLRIKTSVSVQQISFRYDYSASLSIFGISGWLEGSTDCLVFTCDFAVDLKDFMIYMKDYSVVSAGSPQLKLKGNILIDWLSNYFVEKGDSIFHQPIAKAICNGIKHSTQLFVNNLNLYRSDDPNMDPNQSQCSV